MQTINFEAPLAARDLPQLCRQAEKALGSLDSKLLSLRLNFGKLKAALERAVAPITATVVPVLNTAVRALTDFVNDAGAVIAALFGTVQEKAVKTTRVTGKAIKRSLADFDELDRLDAGASGGGSTVTTVTLHTLSDPLTPQLQQTVENIRACMEKIQAFLAPLGNIDLTPAVQAFARLGSAVAGFGGVVAEHLGWAWHNLLVPLAKWTVEAAVPASVDALTGAFGLLRAALEPLLAGFARLAPSLQPAVSFLGETVVDTLQLLRQQFDKVAAVFAANEAASGQIFADLSRSFSALWTAMEPVLTVMKERWGALLQFLGDAAAVQVQGIITVLGGLTEFIAGALTGNWEKAWNGVKTVFKGFVNGLIGLLNAMLTGLVSGVNAAVKALNKLKVDIPGWVPVYGGKSFGFNIKTLTAPQIPYLAQGAVLPPNKPFLAMVGDQKHGTNIEAPLATIEEAVASVVLPGQDAANALLEQILQAIYGIRVGDEVIGRAAQRYQSRRFQMEGGL